MFKSKTRPILFTQYEHGHLAGALARHWGNDSFARPPLDFEAFVAGVTLHDWGYGVVDNFPIGETAEETWLEVIRRGVAVRHEHPTTDIVTKLHMRRLLSWDESLQRSALMTDIDERVQKRLEESDTPLETFQRADKITQLCDMISFDFCFEAPRRRAFAVHPLVDGAETAEISYEIRPDAVISINPWPFSVPVISGVIIAFQRAGFPERLAPQAVPYNIESQSG